jgi:crotonobetainyl-CoA:carnitine CoA-transferase CaiB-like acyl-CoA transferase
MTGPRGGPPTLPGVQIGDLGGGGMLGVAGILAALVARETTGRGRFVDVSMLDGIVSWLSVHAGAYLAGAGPQEAGRAPLSGAYACYRVYRAGDGRYLTVGALEPQFWRALCDALGCPELVDEQFAGPERQDEMAARLQAILQTRSRDEWMEVFRDIPACVGPVNDLAETMDDPQIRHRGMVAEVDGVAVGPGPPLKLSATAGGRLRPAPGFGEHTDEVLGMVGVSEEDLTGLRSRGVV